MASTRQSTSPNYGTVLSPGQSAVYPSSLFTGATVPSSNTSYAVSNGLSKGAIAGIAVGAAVGAILLVAVIIALIVRNRRKRKQAKRESQTALLGSTSGVASQPEMRQQYGATGNTSSASGPYSDVNLRKASMQPVPFPAPVAQSSYHHRKVGKPGLQFGALGTPSTGYDNHRRTDSASSTAPFLPAHGGHTRYSSGETTLERPSTDSDSQPSPEFAAPPRFQD